jgi:hypothetical protein
MEIFNEVESFWVFEDEFGFWNIWEGISFRMI